MTVFHIVSRRTICFRTCASTFVLLALFASSPLHAQSKDGPAAALQTLPVGKLLSEIKTAAENIGGDDAVMAIDNGLKTALGEQGFLGIDLKRPLLGYLVYDANDVENVRMVVMVPTTKPEEFLEFLKRCRLEPEAVEGQKELYKLGRIDLPQPGGAKEYVVHARLTADLAYIGFNMKPAELDAAKLFKPEQVFDSKETALFAFKQFQDRVPPELVDQGVKQYGKMMEQMKAAFPGGAEEGFQAMGRVMESLAKLAKDSKDTGVRLLLDNASGELVFDSYYTPKAGTEFARLTAARTAPTNAMAGIIGKDTAAGLTIQLPVGIKDLQDLALVGVSKLKEKAKDDPPPPYAVDLVKEVFAGVERTIKSGVWDHAGAVNGPDKDGKFTAGFAMTFEDARPIEKALKANFNDFPAMFRENVKLDAEKIGEVNVHSFDPPTAGEPPAYSNVFGDRKMYFAFGPKGIYYAVGANASGMLKAMIEGKPAAAKAFNVMLNPKRTAQLVTAIEPNTGAIAEALLGKEDILQSAMSYSLEGGDALRFRYAINLKMIPRWMGQAAQMRR
jgi:hypothetical protein